MLNGLQRADLAWIESRGGHMRDHRVGSPLVDLPFPEELLTEFLARAQTRVNDVDRTSRRFQHSYRKFCDAYRFAHVEHQHLAVAAERSGLHDQLDCLF